MYEQKLRQKIANKAGYKLPCRDKLPKESIWTRQLTPKWMDKFIIIGLAVLFGTIMALTCW